jgi:hypothetical protein
MLLYALAVSGEAKEKTKLGAGDYGVAAKPSHIKA